MVLMKPATWHCSSQDQGRNLLKQCQQMSSNDRKTVLQKQLMQQDTPALHDFLILRFGADPMFREVMREDMLYGMVGTSEPPRPNMSKHPNDVHSLSLGSARAGSICVEVSLS